MICGGKAHPQDHEGKKMIHNIFSAQASLEGSIQIVYLDNYDLKIAQLMIAGVDLWLNTPQSPFEASGTSGMKAALNGVPSLSILDGWWIEGCIEGITGWSIGLPQGEPKSSTFYDAHSLYDKLDKILPLFYKNQDAYFEVMLHAIALNGFFFQYTKNGPSICSECLFPMILHPCFEMAKSSLQRMNEGFKSSINLSK